MRSTTAETNGELPEKRGIQVYETNPSIPNTSEISKRKRTQIGDERKGFVVDNTNGDVLGHGAAMFYEWEEVDKAKFVKVYLEGIRATLDLSKTGLLVFELVYKQMQENVGKDTVTLSLLASGMKKTAYYGGLRELLEKEFLFRSMYDGTFFVNIRFMFNGDRLAFIKGYKLKKEISISETLSLL